MIFLGIDPGLSGAIAMIPGKTNEAEVWDMPIYKAGTKSFYDIAELQGLFVLAREKAYTGPGSSAEIFCVIERQNPFPGEGVRSVFSLGYGTGILETLLVTNEISYKRVQAKQWQQACGISGKGQAVKAFSFQHARNLFPHVQLVTPRGRQLDGRSDALNIAYYAATHAQFLTGGSRG